MLKWVRDKSEYYYSVDRYFARITKIDTVRWFLRVDVDSKLCKGEFRVVTTLKEAKRVAEVLFCRMVLRDALVRAMEEVFCSND